MAITSLRTTTRCLLLAWCIALAPVASAQETVSYASIGGRVVDSQGAAVVGATVTARQTETNVADAVMTDAMGRFRFAYLRVGPYEITVSQAGFTPYVRQLRANVAAAFDIPVTLQVAGVETAVAVTADAPVLESARSQVAITVPQQEVNNLPLNGRNFVDIARARARRRAAQHQQHAAVRGDLGRAGCRPVGRQPAQPFEQLHRRRPLVQ